jgi:PIN domain nuclease of toxin-antitoxin system
MAGPSASPSLLLDTHALLWWLADDPKLSAAARDAMADAGRTVLVSAASLWEIATKNRLGKLGEADAFLADPVGIIAAEGFEPLPITLPHALLSGGLDTAHRDPFDRMLMAQALLDDLLLVSNEDRFDHVAHRGRAVRRLW